ncbi:peptide chain release factor 2 [Myxococcota bacterium]|nr:peptide chain release factor 2 [Myxococcota bacterium]MBU1535385.1 peptide chain release factor 2 [Myxococcota bacterium]
MVPDYAEIRDLIWKLEKGIGDLATHMHLDDLRKQLVVLEEQSSDPNLWGNQGKAQAILKEASTVRDKVVGWDATKSALDDATLLLSMAQEEDDEEAMEDGYKELLAVKIKVDKLELQEMLSGEMDTQNALLAINAGAGGVDSMDWAEMLQRMYLRYCVRHNFKVSIVELSDGAEAGISSCTLLIEGDYAYGYLKSETGVHRLVRMSPFDSAARRHTSFTSVLVTPDLDDTIDVEVNEDDLRVDVYRASGAGGQHVNKTESAVRLTHLPTGLVSACQNERSQHQNRATAMRMLKAKLYQLKLREQEEKMDNIVGTKQRIDFGSQIRSYVLAPYRLVTDHRTELKIGNVDAILDGSLDEFIHEYLVKFGGK